MAKDDLPVEKINKLSEILKDQGLTEIEIESDGLKIKVRKDAQQVAVAASPAAASPAASTPAAAANNYIEIKSPMVGTFYSSASPDTDAFVKVGDKVSKGDTICIVEAMKLMNELPSEVEGTVKEICVQNAEAISYGQVIMRLEA
ncbi:MAG: acetyl-CoA carboxylase biotin carboxyl carrier protein [Candidatus Melainabacteria bacterium]|jgi:acetyl-CoA carboxylase biotin carboxyl carrier protein|nr:acetyl-CoA carboxylase biotin carboxyl carrier protein [Candidatus Melainabacteria bacterium]